MKYEYEIGGKKYIQRPLVLGQVRQLMKLLQGLVFPKDINTIELIALLGDRLPQAIAIVLTPDGVNLKDKDINAIASDLEFEISPETTIEVIENFFDCNPIPSLLEKVSGMAQKIGKAMIKEQMETGSTPSSVSLLEETSPKETQSSGAIH